MTEASRHGAEIQPFWIDVPQEDLDDLHDRLGRTGRPGEILGAGWDRAVPPDLLVCDMRGFFRGLQ